MTIPGLAMLGRQRGIEGIIRQLSDADQRLAQYQAASLPLAALLQALFDTPGGTAKLVTPEQYGAVGNMVADDSEALLEAASLGVPVFCDPTKVYGTSQPIIHAPGTFFTDGRLGRALTGTSGAKIQALNSFSGGDAVLVFPPGTVGGGVGVSVGGLGNISSALAGVLIEDGCYNITTLHAWIGNLSDSAIRMTGHPVACNFFDSVLGYDVTGRTLTGPNGVLEVTGSDHLFDQNLEVFGGPAYPGGPNGSDRVSYPGQFWRCGVLLYGECHNMVFGNVVPEFADTGWYIASAGSGANLNRWIGSRSDYSAGPGWYLTGTTDNLFIGVQTNGAGFASAYDGNFYDGALLTGGTARSTFDLFQLDNGGAPHLVRYGWRDETTGNGTQNENRLINPQIRPEDCLYDTVFRAEPRSPIRPGGSGPLRDRPPSRWANGQTWPDTERGVLCYSDGSAWRDSFGGVSGNLATPAAAEGIGGTLQLQAADSKCTVGVGYSVLGNAHSLMPTAIFAGAACTAAGVTAGFFAVAVTADTLGFFTPVTAGDVYTFTVSSVAETIAATLSLTVNWFDVTNTFLSSTALLTATGGGTNSTSALTDTYWHGVTAPVGAVYAEPVFRFTRAGMALGEAHWLNRVTIMADSAGLVTGYVRP